MSDDRNILLGGKPLTETADLMASSASNTHADQMAKAEFLRRQTEFIEREAKAAEETSKSTRQYTKYMLWSVIILTLSTFGTLILEILRFIQGR